MIESVKRILGDQRAGRAGRAPADKNEDSPAPDPLDHPPEMSPGGLVSTHQDAALIQPAGPALTEAPSDGEGSAAPNARQKLEQLGLPYGRVRPAHGGGLLALFQEDPNPLLPTPSVEQKLNRLFGGERLQRVGPSSSDNHADAYGRHNHGMMFPSFLAPDAGLESLPKLVDSLSRPGVTHLDDIQNFPAEVQRQLATLLETGQVTLEGHAEPLKLSPDFRLEVTVRPDAVLQPELSRLLTPGSPAQTPVNLFELR